MSNCVYSGMGGVPLLLVAGHGVEDAEDLSGNGDERDLGRLAGRDEALVEGFEDGLERLAVRAAI